MVSSPNRLTIDLSALGHNLKLIRELIGPEKGIMGIVKSDAYGHGILRVSRFLEEKGVFSLGVSHVYEASELRKGGIKIPIVILCGITSRDEAKECVDKDLTPVIFDISTAEMLAGEAAGRKKKLKVHLKIDTGMGRLGVHYFNAGPFIEKILGLSNLHVEEYRKLRERLFKAALSTHN